MANVSFLSGYNRIASSINLLLAVYGNDVVNVDTNLGYNLNLESPDQAVLEQFLDHTFLQNYVNLPRTFNGTSWGTTNVSRTPYAKIQKNFKNRMYLGYCKLGDPSSVTTAGPWPSRVFKSDLPANDRLTWGVEWGTNLKTTQGSPVVQTGNSIQDFAATNIKVGDPIYITNLSVGLFKSFVKSVDTRYQLTLVDDVPETSSAADFWVGSNWFDVDPDDNDYLTAFGEVAGKLAIFKQFSLSVYNEVSTQPVKDAPGTASPKSVVTIGDYLYYFHGSNSDNRRTGVYLCNGYKSVQISTPIQWYIDGIAPGYYGNVVGWREGNRLRMYVGDITNSKRDIDVDRVVITLDTDGWQWSIDPVSDEIVCAGRFVEGGSEKYFIGNSSGEVFETSNGYSFDGDSIPWTFETGPRFPAGTSIVSQMPRILVVSRNAMGVQVSYKLVGTPHDVDDQWRGLGDIEHDFQEFNLPFSHNTARGINLKFTDTDGNLNSFTIQKVTIFYEPKNLRSKT